MHPERGPEFYSMECKRRVEQRFLAGEAPGVHNVGRLLEAGERAALPEAARLPLRLLAEQFFATRGRIDQLTKEIRCEAEARDDARRLQTIPGIGPITATAFAATLPDVSGFPIIARSLRVAWSDPETTFERRKGQARENVQDGEPLSPEVALPRVMGLITKRRRGEAGDDWLWRLLQRRSAKQAAIALANRMARTVWALLRNGTEYEVARAT